MTVGYVYYVPVNPGAPRPPAPPRPAPCWPRGARLVDLALAIDRYVIYRYQGPDDSDERNVLVTRPGAKRPTPRAHRNLGLAPDYWDRDRPCTCGVPLFFLANDKRAYHCCNCGAARAIGA